jgi:hypothetical protein
MQAKEKLAKEKKAAKKIAAIMCKSLRQFSSEEQEQKLQDILEITSEIARKPSGKISNPAKA